MNAIGLRQAPRWFVRMVTLVILRSGGDMDSVLGVGA